MFSMTNWKDCLLGLESWIGHPRLFTKRGGLRDTKSRRQSTPIFLIDIVRKEDLRFVKTNFLTRNGANNFVNNFFTIIQLLQVTL